MSLSYNLIEEEWLPVIRRNGKPERVGIRTALVEAGRIREVRGASPLDTVAVYRFLLAVLQWCKKSATGSEVANIRRRGGFPGEWLEKLEKHKRKFELLGEKDGFYQDRTAWEDVKSKAKPPFRPATDLLQELPSATNVAHFRHIRDFQDSLCPSCCALGLIRLSAFATHSTHPPYPSGKPSGINGGTPMYAVPLGETLLQTLLLNWPLPTKKGDRPGWLSAETPAKDNIGCLAGFTWRPRRIWLERPDEKTPIAVCSSCGQQDRLIRRIAFLPGWGRPFGKEQWPDDPYLLIHIKEPKAKKARRKLQPMSFPDASRPPDGHARTWRRAYRAILQSLIRELEADPPPQHRHLKASLARAGGRQRVTVACYGPALSAGNQTLYKDTASLEWRLPVCQLDTTRARTGVAEVDRLDGIWLWAVLRAALPGQASKRPELKAVLAVAATEAEIRLRQRFERFVETLASCSSNEVKQCVRDWRNDAQMILAGQLHKACAVLGTGSVLRCREQVGRADWALRKALEKVQKAEEKQAETGDKPAVPAQRRAHAKRPRRKRKGGGA